MAKLILTTDVNSAGQIKLSNIADRVVALAQRLIIGPLPNPGNTERFFGSLEVDHELQDDTEHWQSWIGMAQRRKLGSFRPSLLETCKNYDRVEVWVDPHPNSYLVLFQLLTFLKAQFHILDVIFLAFPERYLGALSDRAFESNLPPVQPLTSDQLELAWRAWIAHNCDTPEAWFALLSEDLSAIPGLREAVLGILAELPSIKNGLTASEAQLLMLIDAPGANHASVFTRYLQAEPRPTLDYWEAGSKIVSLSCCQPPLILGVEEDSFALELHEDSARYAAYLARTWSLSPVGKRIIAGADDIASLAPVDRWLGNTHLTPERLWRWDSSRLALIEPKWQSLRG